MPNSELAVLIVDDHQLVAEGLATMVEGISVTPFERVRVVEIARSGESALDWLTHHELPNLILMDVNLPRINGMEATSEIRDRYRASHLKILGLSMHRDSQTADKMFRAGANGYMSKDCTSEQLTVAISAILAGGRYEGQNIERGVPGTTRVEQDSDKLHLLTKREKEILVLIAHGLTASEIGDQLFISPRTVDAHRRNLLSKLELHSVTQLVAFAFRSGLIE